MNTATIDTLRAEFEAYAARYGYRLDRAPGLNGTGAYIDRTTAALWHCWRTAKGAA